MYKIQSKLNGIPKEDVYQVCDQILYLSEIKIQYKSDKENNQEIYDKYKSLIDEKVEELIEKLTNEIYNTILDTVPDESVDLEIEPISVEAIERINNKLKVGYDTVVCHSKVKDTLSSIGIFPKVNDILGDKVILYDDKLI